MSIPSLAQTSENSNLRRKWVYAQNQTLDKLLVDPSSFQVLQIVGEAKNENILFENQQLIFNADSSLIDSVLVSYRVLDFNSIQTNTTYSSFHFKSDTTSNTFSNRRRNNRKSFKRESLFDTGEVQTMGSISRGFSIGSNQDFYVNSGLNLQLQGAITEDILLEASITDSQVPYQPEGNTQNIQDFDRILIKLSHEKGSLSAGDVQIMDDKISAFLRYTKNVQGLQATANFGNDSSKYQSKTVASISQAKGQFHRQEIVALEGVKGPYRLLGPQNENNIVVIAGSEKVYIDGILMKRGFDQDYVIDYNLAEITFTAKQVITQNSRIRVDFEYAVQYFARTISQVSHEQRIGKFTFFTDFYQEKDNKNTSLFYQLSDEEKRLIASKGDNIDEIYVNSIDTVSTFDPNKIQYTYKDSIVNNVPYTDILVRADNSAELLVQANFTNVGTNNGDYVFSTQEGGGRVYKWVAPINGVPQGDFAPIRKLYAPNQKSLWVFGGEFKPRKNDKIYAEIGLSNQDLNLFATTDKHDDNGAAYNFGFETNNKLNQKVDWKLYADYQQTSDNFKAIDPFRSVEYDRDWGVVISEDEQDKILSTGTKISWKEKDYLSYDFLKRDRGLSVDGMQHQLKLSTNPVGKLQLDGQAFLMENQILKDTTVANWERYQADIRWNGAILQPGYTYREEKNTLAKGADNETLSSVGYFEEHTVYIESGDSIKAKIRADYTQREDYYVSEGAITPYTEAEMVGFRFSNKGKTTNWVGSINYRELTYKNTSDDLVEKTLTARLDLNKHWWKRNINTNFSYETGTGQELKKEYVFLQVEAGRGTHTWRDDNGNGIQELEEFYPAQNPDERNYAKFYVPTGEYIPAYSTLFLFNLNIRTPKAWLKEKGIKNVLARLSLVSSINSDRKTTSEDLQERFLPFTPIAEADLISQKVFFKNSLFINRADPKWGAEVKANFSDAKSLLSSGFERRINEEYMLISRLKLTKDFSFQNTLAEKIVDQESDFLEEQSYDYTEWRVAPELIYQHRNDFRISGQYSYKHKNAPLVGENDGGIALFHKGTFEMRWAKAIKRSISASLALTHINYEGEVNTPLGYEMLEGLRNGVNYQWNIRWTQRLVGGLQMNALYDGRKSENQKMIHTAQLQLTALF
ncbi:hypothetical protein [Sediminitomix flava]|uniref:hypothetical protein n=1 Tax=Sediminitomix flava TaxID=379075 RepID=UPI0011B296B6|nr:hypothetical protein [Sediminitomix flava]